MAKLYHVNLNSCLGFMALGFESANPDIETLMFYETNKPCRYTLEQYWSAPVVCSVDETVRGVKRHVAKEKLDLVTARYRSPKDWDVIGKVVAAAKPRVVVIESMASLRGHGLVDVLQRLWSLGYDAEGHIVPACTLGARYKGERFWLVAHANPDGLEESGESEEEQGGVGKLFITDDALDEFRAGLEGGRAETERSLADQPRLLRRDDKVSRKVDAARVRLLSDDVSPVVAAFISFCVSRVLRDEFTPLPVAEFSLVECIQNAAKKHAFLVNTSIIQKSGVAFIKRNSGVHLVVTTANQKTIDYWPSTDVYIVRGTTIRGFGAREVVSMCASL